MTFDTEIGIGYEKVTVDYTFYRGYPGSMESPPEPEDVEINSVMWVPKEGQLAIDIMGLLSEQMIDALVEECFKDVEGVRRDYEESRAADLYDDMKARERGDY